MDAPFRPAPYVVLTEEALQETVDYFSDQPAFVFDVETTGHHRGVPTQNEVLWIALATEGRVAVIPMGHPNGDILISKATKKKNKITGKFDQIPAVFDAPPKQLRPGQVFKALKRLFFSDQVKIAHNATFDLVSVAKYLDGEVPSAPQADTIVLSWLLDENRKTNALKELVKSIYEHDYDQEHVGRCVEIHPFWKVARYAYLDARYTWLLWRRFMPYIERVGVTNTRRLEEDLLPVLCDMRKEGALVDQEAAQELDADLQKIIVELEGTIYQAAGQRFNINSNPQKTQILYGSKKEGCLGLKPHILTDGGKAKKRAGQQLTPQDWSTSKEALEYHETNPVVAALLDYQEANRLSTGYIRAYLGDEEAGKPSILFNSRIHADLVQYGTVTGRFSCVTPDTLIEMPRDLVEYPDGIPMRDVKAGDWVYSFTWDKRLTLSRVKWIGPTKVAERTLKVSIVDRFGKLTSFTATPEHLVRKYDGSWMPTGLLKEGDRLMGMLQRRYTEEGYAYFPPSKKRALPGKETGGKISEHRLVYSMVHGKRLSTNYDVHHQDHNKANNHWENLDYLFKADHVSNHKATTAAQVQAMLDGAEMSVHPKTLRRLARKYGLQPTNHTIISIEEGPRDVEVWDMEVEGTHNFIGGDVCLHNCREPNLQNIPRPDTKLGKRVRGLFIPPPGYSMVVADYSQVELAILAHYAGHGRLWDGFVEGIDAHTATAAAIFGVPIDQVIKAQRTVAKALAFATVYGAGPVKVAAMAGVSEADARRFLADHQRMFPEIYRLKDRIIEKCASRNPPHIRTLLGRYRRLPAMHSQYKGLRGQAERQAVNSLIQGSQADLIKLSMIRLHRTLPEDMKLILSVHDELVTIVPENKAEEGVAIVREAMEGDGISRFLRVPLRADVKVVQRWSDAK